MQCFFLNLQLFKQFGNTPAKIFQHCCFYCKIYVAKSAYLWRNFSRSFNPKTPPTTPKALFWYINFGVTLIVWFYIQTKHDDHVLTCEKCELTCKGGRKLIDTHGFVQGIYLQTLREKNPHNCRSSHMTKWQSNVKIALLSSTQRIIWKFTWLTLVVKSNATSVKKHWTVKVIWKSTSHTLTECKQKLWKLVKVT